MNGRKCVYVAGKYSGTDYLNIDRNIVAAREAAAELFNAGVMAFIPHLHAAHFECITPEVPYEFWTELDMHFLRTSCQAVYFLPGWESSRGSVAEHTEAQILRYPIFYNIEDAIAWGMED